MSVLRTSATALRVLRQLRRDPRTVALLLLVPCVLLWLLSAVFSSQSAVFDRVGPALLGIFPFVSMFLVTSVATLRERTSGTFERLMTMPISKLDLIAGYALGFAVVAVLQGVIATVVSLQLLGLDIAGPVWSLLVVAVLDALLGVALGLLVSAFAATEFQAVQFLPAVVLPQVLLCGLIAPREQMARGLELLSDVLPLTYAADAMGELSTSTGFGGTAARDCLVVVGSTVLALALGAATLRRRTP
ncbi:ABC-2 type transport system permease protein [Motilibacter peucedani]|uniref:Transport permease protein n=1 Tax=Motilibacter peucedani TaxID=598650 RepID=A0A420XPR2_9ACTN|nr:ABC transporter permease [Motilibacter peucedani]RKS75232.1 ABC-2 type transport system permease protein [Motilibacter peucedani]